MRRAQHGSVAVLAVGSVPVLTVGSVAVLAVGTQTLCSSLLFKIILFAIDL
jgi:hypothetical protein